MKTSLATSMTTTIAFSALLLSAGAAHAANKQADKQAQAPEVDPSTMVSIEGGTFTMGTSTDEELGRYGDRWFVNEQPAHEVTVDAFSLDRHEVTVAEFALFLTWAAGDYHWHPNQHIEKVDGGYLPVEGTANEPVRFVTWQAADHYCKWAGKRLPTEAEWEYAAAGTDNREFPWGDVGAGCEAANYFAGASFCQQGVLDVGSLAAGQTPEGVFDMAGNVAEWVADPYARYPDDGAAQTNPTGPQPTDAEAGTLRVVRGGGHLSSGRWRRTKARWGANPERRSRNIGFRCAWDADLAARPDGAVRGELSAPSDENRRQTDRPLAPAAELPAVVTDGLLEPGAIVAAGGQWYVLDRGAGSIVSIDPTDWTVASVYEGLNTPTEMVTDGASLFVADPGAETIVQVDPTDGTSTTLADAQVDPRALAANETHVVWLSETTLRRHDTVSDTVEDVLTDLVNPSGIELVGPTIFYSTKGGAAETTLSYIDTSGAEGAQVMIDKDSIGLGDNMQYFYTQHIHVDAEGWLWFDLRYRSFPNNALALCRIDLQEGSGDCPTYTPPPHHARMVTVGPTVYFPVRNTIIRYTYGEDDAFSEVTPWTRAGGIVATEEFVVWTDEQNGRVYYRDVR